MNVDVFGNQSTIRNYYQYLRKYFILYSHQLHFLKSQEHLQNLEAVFI